MLTSTPLHERTHWRHLRIAIRDIADYEKINISDYNLNNIRCYDVMGDELNARYVKFETNNGKSCFIDSNKYEVYEIANNSNSERFRFCGEFLFFIRNASFDYWLFGIMTCRIDYNESKRAGTLIERVSFRPYGKYEVSFGNDREHTYINKSTRGGDMGIGKSMLGVLRSFDGFSSRKIAYQGITNQIVMSRILGNGKDSSINAIDDKPVKKYRKNRNKPSHNNGKGKKINNRRKSNKSGYR